MPELPIIIIDIGKTTWGFLRKRIFLMKGSMGSGGVSR